MKTIYKLLFLLLLTFFVKDSMGQNREIIQETITQTHFNIPNDLHAKLSPIDLSTMSVKDVCKITTQVIDEAGYLHVEERITDPVDNAADMEFKVTKIVSNVDGISLFNSLGKELRHTKHEESVANEYVIKNESLRNFGVFNHIFEVPIRQTHDELIRAGYAVKLDEAARTLRAENSQQILLLDYRNYFFSYMLLDKKGLKASRVTQYTLYEGHLIPVIESYTTNTYTMDDIPVARTEVTFTTHYRIIEHGETILEYHDERLSRTSKGQVNIRSMEYAEEDEGFTIYPNPASKKINIELPSFMEGEIFVEIINSSGIVVSAEKVKNKSKITFNISSLPPGYYAVRCYNTAHSLSKPIVITQ
ncbi:T9SS type A sorting domain-containing protein [Bacteroidales bacterium OttesenSCG-928-B11]|nr:T9SS type A sorting domain-containing protein [Bacteroidales bacterium OttesenSCG-928-B11]